MSGPLNPSRPSRRALLAAPRPAGGYHQQWRLASAGNGRHQIVNRGTNTALDGMGNTAAGSTASMWAPNTNTNNHWTITAV